MITNNFIYSDCYELERANEYFGKIATTISGGECAKWAELDWDELEIQDPYFPENSVTDAENYCRSPDYDPQPWCWAYDEDGSGDWNGLEFGYCNVPICRGIFQSIINFN